MLRKLVSQLVAENAGVPRRPFDGDQVRVPVTKFLEFSEASLRGISRCCADAVDHGRVVHADCNWLSLFLRID